MKSLKTTLKGNFSFYTIALIFVIVCIISGTLSFQYYNQLQSAIRSESRDYLQEISRGIGENINIIINDNYSNLYTTSDILQKAKAESFANVNNIIEGQEEYWTYEKLLLIDENGKAYDKNGNEAILNNNTYFDSISSAEHGISTTQMIDNQEYVMLTAPLTNLAVDGKKMVALAAVYHPKVFEETLAMLSFNGEAYSCVINKSGTVVMRPSATSSIKFGYNILTSVNKMKFDEGDSIDKIKKDMGQNLSGQVGVTQNNVRYYMVYSPVNEDGWYLTTFVPSNVVNEKSDMLLHTTLILCGIVALIFAGLIAIVIYIYDQNKKRLEKIAYVDEATGGHTIQKFYLLVQEALKEAERPTYALVYTNMQKFKLLNEQFGRRACDSLLKAFYFLISEDLKGRECMARISADNFCILVEYTNEQDLTSRLTTWYNSAEKYIINVKPSWIMPITEFGVFTINNDSIPLTQLIDRAKLSLRDLSKMLNSKIRYAIYTDGAHQKLIREKQLEDSMEFAMETNEFQMYLQPKYQLPEEKIGGAEALIRWESVAEGMIYPNEFIPLFEKNGFIIKIDLWMFEQACKAIRKWIDKGLQPIKISINCSRIQLNNPEFLKDYRMLAEKYNVPPKYLEIELTESVVMENVKGLGKIIDSIHQAGFGCSMDDFGSGYSSLNLIQSIPVDTLKIDKIFFDSDGKDLTRMESVVGSIVTMAKALSMKTVAEGVEYPEQVEMLHRIECDFIQGYVFARPMPLNAFEEIAFEIVSDGEEK